jgi:hypothetical protein
MVRLRQKLKVLLKETYRLGRGILSPERSVQLTFFKVCAPDHISVAMLARVANNKKGLGSAAALKSECSPSAVPPDIIIVTPIPVANLFQFVISIETPLKLQSSIRQQNVDGSNLKAAVGAQRAANLTNIRAALARPDFRPR